MPFDQHGEYKIWVKGKVLYATLHGSWNEQAAENYARDFKRQAKSLPKPWGHIVYLNNWELCTPEMFPIITELVDWCIANGLERAANVFERSRTKEGFVNKMVAQQEGAFVRAVFDNEEDAVNWLAAEGFHAEVNEGQ